MGLSALPTPSKAAFFFFFFTLKKGHQVLSARASHGLFSPFSLSQAKVRRVSLGCECSQDRALQELGSSSHFCFLIISTAELKEVEKILPTVVLCEPMWSLVIERITLL